MPPGAGRRCAAGGVGKWDTRIFVLLLVFALVGDRLEVEAKLLRISGAFLAIGLAMVVLGPVPAVIIGVITTAADSIQRRPPLNYVASNLATFLVFPLLGGWMVHEAASAWNLGQGDIDFSVVVIAAFVIANAVNFVQIAVTRRIMVGASIGAATRELFLPLLPSQLVIGILAAFIVYGHAHGGGVLLGLLVGVVVLYSTCCASCCSRASGRSSSASERRSSPRCRWAYSPRCSRRISLRDKMTARHCAAVARYAREIAREAGCDDEMQDLVHTAGLLHDIGKFIFPDHILLANTKLNDDDWEIVKKHRPRARRSCARSRATGRLPTSSWPTTRRSTARATRVAWPARRSRCSRA